MRVQKGPMFFSWNASNEQGCSFDRVPVGYSLAGVVDQGRRSIKPEFPLKTASAKRALL